MTRGVGEHALIRETLPDWLAVLFGLVTQLGDTWFLLVLLAVLFWRARPSRSGVAFVTGAWLAGIGLYRGLKVTLALPRPAATPLDPQTLPTAVETLYQLTAFGAGYGFPSGHAVNSTVVYVGLATVWTACTVRRRYGVAGAIVLGVTTSRIVLGLHFLVDVVVGAGLALGLLAGIRALGRHVGSDTPTVAFATAVPFAGFYAVASGGTLESIALAVAAVGGLIGWRRYRSRLDD
ncbi:phosphatase PAP2 family protein [Halovivax limisalsi]|uniref:phosphatase PAP2 family protein n=1 Tax=Halovivax limisalsi TaxID=1453760 RepID=UPI001FFD2188|nr:phosphatase PAP2 family protein [Halovivax limisalsi]